MVSCDKCGERIEDKEHGTADCTIVGDVTAGWAIDLCMPCMKEVVLFATSYHRQHTPYPLSEGEDASIQ
jgi:hypothetical protein